MPEIDNAKQKEIFDLISAAIAGAPVVEGAAAIQDILVALICLLGNDREAAIEFSRAMQCDIERTITKNFDWYHRQLETSAVTVTLTRKPQ